MIAAVDLTIDRVLRGHYATCGEQEQAMHDALAELRIDG